MKIITIRFKNIHSLRGEHQVDFDRAPLSDCGLFAIIGPTGSGKSTLLDVICLALFNQTPRLGTISQTTIDSAGALMTRGTADAYAEVTYDTGGKRYLSHWDISTARTGKLRDYHMQLACLTDDRILDLKKSQVPEKNAEIIGLSYDQFVKSILLSQGEFARFLQAKPHERSELLEKITGNAIYRQLGKLAFERKKSENEKLNLLAAQIQEIALMDAGQEAQKQAQAATLKTNIETGRGHLETLANRLHIALQSERLKNEESIAHAENQQIEKELAAFATQEAELERQNALRLLSADFERHRQTSELIRELNSRQTKYTLERERLGAELRALQEIESQYDTQIADLEKSLPAQRELWTKIEVLDLQLTKLVEKIEGEQNQTNSLQAEQILLQQEIAKLTSAIHDVENQIQNEKNWLQAHTKLAGLSADLALLIRMGEDYITHIKSFNKETAALYPDTPHWKDKGEAVSNDLTGTEQLIEKSLAKCRYPLHDLSAVEQDLSNLRERYQRLKQMGEKAQEYNNLQNSLKSYVAETDSLKVTTGTAAGELKACQEQLVVTGKRLEEVRQHLVKQRTEASYEQARAHLREGEPCPLCGATSHPYVSEYQADVIGLERLENELRLQYEQVGLRRDDAELRLREAQTTLSACEARKETTLLQITEINRMFEHLQSVEFKEVSKIAPEMILRRRDEVEQQGRELKEQSELLRTADQAARKLSELKPLAALFSMLKSREQEWKQALSPYVEANHAERPVAEWLETLRQLAGEYALHEKSLENQTAEAEKKRILLGEKQTAYATLTERYSGLKQALDEKMSDYEQLKHSRRELFGDKTVRGEEQQFQSRHDDLQQKRSETRNNIQGHKAALEAGERQLDETGTELLERQQNLNEIELSLNQKLINIGFSSISQARDALKTDSEIAILETRRQQLTDRYKASQLHLSDVKRRLSELSQEQCPESPAESIKAEKDALEQQLAEWERTVGAIFNELSINSLNAERVQQLRQNLQDQKIEYDRWDQLVRLIGDADGKKFATFAQEITLSYLLTLSNLQLQKFTDRYMLDCENLTGDLSVVDTYMANTRRSVRTLSGGETFLVSLSLALGLSDMAGNSTRLESLFIDEGFGSLDQQTLDTALDALDRLQSETNRTIGLISHVESLKERITAKITLRKEHGGYSSILVTGA